MTRYLYIGVGLDAAAVFSNDALDQATGRHRVALDPGPLAAVESPVVALGRSGLSGVVIAAASGAIDRARLRLAKAAIRRGLRVWFHWPNEQSIEYVDGDRLRSLARLRLAVILMERGARPMLQLVDASTRVGSGWRWIYHATDPVRPAHVVGIDTGRMLAELDGWSRAATPVPFARDRTPSNGPGLYLRTDFWNTIESGGSYGHTCYVAKELAATATRFACLLPHRYDLLDTLGVFQTAMDAPDGPATEEAMVTATPHYGPIVRTACGLLEPAYIYERLCLGNWTAPLVSRELRIPYIVEYNGSEITMQRARNNTVPVYTDVYVKAEELAFRQATAISVVSDHIKSDLVGRGIDARKILVNPNGADLDRYAPASADEKRDVRHSLGFGDDECVVGFIGTFGWWHGIDVLAAAIPRVCREFPRARFLLVGDGNYKHELDAEVDRHGLASRVLRPGSVPQDEGKRLLKACDIYVSPHSRHMDDGKFFGSPTKIFEYMAMGGAIVASDLEQIGHVLSPAVRAAVFARDDLRIADERAVLCTPGDVDEFVAAVVGLARRPDVGCALGRNARHAVATDYSWRRHVERLWAFVDQLPCDEAAGEERADNPQPHSLEWFAEIERARYARAPWLQSTVDAIAKPGGRVLDIGVGPGTDSARLAAGGADVTGVDLSHANVALAYKNFEVRGLRGRFVEWNGRTLPFDDGAFDVVYSDGLDDAPSAPAIVHDIHRVLKPAGTCVVVLRSERSLQYWYDAVWKLAVRTGDISRQSVGAILAQSLDPADRGRKAVQVFTPRAARTLFGRFAAVHVEQHDVPAEALPPPLRRFAAAFERFVGAHLVITATP